MLLIAVVLFMGGQLLFAQTKNLTGVVTSSEDGSTVPGASIMVKGTTLGTITDIDGNFTLKVPEDARVLVVSFVGMKTTEVVIGSQTSFSISLESDIFGLDEVIVAGVAAETPKKKLAVSVARVDAETLNEVPAGSASSALQGKVSGVSVISSTGEPGSSSTILIRGATQIAGSQTPLIVIDGAISEGSLGDINVDDIESMEVVKGASASALYGSRAGNGVIVITTKRGSGAKGKTIVTVRNEFGVNTLAKKYDLATHHEYELADDWESYQGIYTKYAGVTYDSGYAGGTEGISDDRTASADQYMDNPYGVVYDHEDDFFEGGNFYTNYIAVENSSDKTNFMASFENYDQGGIVFETDGYRRNSFRLNIDHRISDKLSISASNLYVKTATQDPGGTSYYNGGVFFNLLLTQPDVNLFLENPDGQPYSYFADPWSSEENPLYQLWKIKENTEKSRFLGSYSGKWKITSDLNLEARYAFEVISNNYEVYEPYDTYTADGSSTTYSEGSLELENRKRTNENIQTTLNYSKKLGDINLRNKASFLYENMEYKSFDVTGNDFGIRDIPSFDAIVTNDNEDLDSYQSQVVAKNFFEILYLDYKDKYIFDGMFRYDGSSLFGENERWHPYFRVSGAWRVTEDVKINNIQELKLRAAYGTAGQRPAFADQYEYLSVDDGKTSKTQLGNKNLKPSLSKELEFGLDVDFLNRFSFEAVYSTTRTEDQFLDVPLAAYLGGYESQVQNAGTMEAQVFEASLMTNVIRKKDFQWSINLTFDKQKVKISELSVPAYLTGPQGQDADLFYIKEGETFGAMYGYSFVHTLDEMAAQLSDGESIDDYTVNGDGFVIEKGTEGTTSEGAIKKLDSEGSTLFSKIGDPTPDFNMNIATNLNYKGFGLYVLCLWKQGGDIYNKSAQWLTRDNRHGMLDQYGKPENEKKTVNYYQSLYDTNNFNEFWVEDGTFFKVKEVSLSYSFPEDMLSRIGNGVIKNAKLSFIGRNLLTLTNYSGYDPEVQTYGSSQYFAYDFMGYPNFRSFSASLELKF